MRIATGTRVTHMRDKIEGVFTGTVEIEGRYTFLEIKWDDGTTSDETIETIWIGADEAVPYEDADQRLGGNDA